MMLRRLAMVCGVAAVMGMAAVGARAEQVDNPQYKAWVPYKAGTTVTLKMTTTMSMPGGQDMKMDMRMTRKLVEITADKAVVETTVSMDRMGQMTDMPATKMDVPAKIEKGQENQQYMPKDGDAKATVKDVKVGKDTVEVSGKKLETTTHEATVETEVKGQTTTTKTKTWYTTEVPGGLVKMEMSSEQPMKRTSVMEVVEFKVEK